MATVTKTQLELTLSNGKKAYINLPEPAEDIDTKDHTADAAKIMAVYETDDAQTASALKIYTVTTTTAEHAINPS